MVTTDCIIFCHSSKFIGDRTVNNEYSEQEVSEHLSKQYVVVVGQTKERKQVLSIRKANDLTKSLIAI